MKLSPVLEKFVLHWGEMGTRWGVNRTVAQIHALLYASENPLHAEEIAETLAVARSNVSTSIKELQNWGIVKTVHVLGDRRDHFESIQDPWELFRIVLEERKRRDIDPTLRVLAECVGELEKEPKSQAHLKKQLKALHEFFSLNSTWYDEFRRLPTQSVIKFVKLGGKVSKLLGLAS